MNIVISEGSLFSNSSERSLFSAHHTGSNSPVTHINPVQKTQPVKSDVIRDAEKDFVKENTPAANISISSAGRAALLSLTALNNGLKNYTESADNISKSQVSLAKDDPSAKYTLDLENTEARDVRDDSFGINEKAEPVEEPVKVKNTSNLSMYTDVQLKTMVSDGDITRGEMQQELDKRESAETAKPVDTDPVMKQAIAAYNFQMSYQIHAQMYN